MGKQFLRNEKLFFILSDILFAEQVSIERNNPVIVIFRHLLQLLPNLYFFMSCSICFFFMSCSGLFFMSLSGLLSLCHVRACPGHRPHGFPGQAHTLPLPLPDLIRHSSVEQGIHRHKAWPHDMHAESIARQQRFVPQPIMRSSRQQLVIFARGLLKK